MWWWILGLVVVILFLFFWWIFPLFFHGIPWQPTDMKRVRRMLEMAKPNPNELLVDLGCGDGRICIEAARRFGIRAIGYEINPWLYLLARLRIFFSGVSHRVRVELRDIHQVDLSQVNIVTLFLFQHVNDRLEKKLSEELPSGSRVVSYIWIFKGWQPAEIDRVLRLYLYIR
ncbi:MAG TPA: class I SAM-dependent methyltransferase [Atribacteraceae bacterium]|nr:class I SAM-dependent methyltransferase [Atribacteraceae bacterium]